MIVGALELTMPMLMTTNSTSSIVKERVPRVAIIMGMQLVTFSSYTVEGLWVKITTRLSRMSTVQVAVVTVALTAKVSMVLAKPFLLTE